MRAFKVFLICLAALSLAPAVCRPAQVMSTFEEKTRYERALEQKAEEIVVKVLGPNQARVTVEATLKIEEAFGNSGSSDSVQGQFAWMGSAQNREKMKVLLPGFTASASVVPMGSEESRSYSYKVSKLSVNIVSGGQITQPQLLNLRDLLEKVLGLDMKRGDTLEVVRTQFAPIWKTIWYSPEYLGLFIRYGVVAVVIIISFIIIGFGILRLAGAMGQVAKVQEVSIGFNGEGGAHGGQPGLPGLPGREPEKGGKAPAAPAIPEDPGRLTFNVKREQVPLLASMLKKEDPENISLVVYHLPDEVRGELLSCLGKDLASQVILKLATVRFVDRDMIEEVKEELEKRLDSAVGGVQKAVEMITPMRYSEKKEMVRKLETFDPQVAAEIRSGFIFDEDLLSLPDKDMGLVASAIPVMEWAEVFPSLPGPLQEKIKKQLSVKSVEMIDQTIRYSKIDPRRSDEAMDKFMGILAGMVKEGRIAKPAPQPGLLQLDKNAPGKDKQGAGGKRV